MTERPIPNRWADEQLVDRSRDVSGAAPERARGAYNGRKAVLYDTYSVFNKGNREYQSAVLRDILGYRGETSTFCDLGCGTGAFSQVILEAEPGSRGLGIDASIDMLDRARARLSYFHGRFEGRREQIEAIDWAPLESQFELVFSSLALHHLSDHDKWQCFRGVFQSLRPGGWFVLYDLMKVGDPVADDLLEHLACADIYRRLSSRHDVSETDDRIVLSQIITRDREMRADDGDREAELSRQLEVLRSCGFEHVVVIFQEARLFGAVAIKAR